MRGKKARALRKKVWGDDKSPRYRRYTRIKGQLLADDERQIYQTLKGRRPHMKEAVKEILATKGE